MQRFDWYVHGLWIVGTLFAFAGAMMAGNIEWVEGANTVSYGLAALIAFLLILVAGMCWISSAVNARQEERKTESTRFAVA
ncbi:MAG: hypothetical protein QW548_00195 [Candidatus Aenigmatarchaeota archaeon]